MRDVGMRVLWAYVGTVSGLLFSTVFLLDQLPFYWGTAGLVAGVLAARAPVLQRNPGPAVGGAMGALAGNVAVAHYLVMNIQPSFDETWWDYRMITIVTTAGMTLLGAAVGFIPGLRRDASPLLWATGLSIGLHVVARSWLEDHPTATGLALLGSGLIIGAIVGLQRQARRFALLPLGALFGMVVGFLLFLMAMFWHIDPWMGYASVVPHKLIPLGAGLGAVAGFVMSVGGRSGLSREPVSA